MSRNYKYDPVHDNNKDYRRDEISPEVYALMEKVRTEQGREVPVYAINKAINLQQSRSVLTACNFIRYFLLHELNHVDVFGSISLQYDRELAHYKQCEDIELKVDILTDIVNDMSVQMNDMQQMMMNMAKMLNNSHIRARRSA